MTAGALAEADLPPLTGSDILDPWRIRLRLQLRGELVPPPSRGATPSETVLWQALDSLSAGWCREYATGPYRLDFYLPVAGLAVEVDGGSHYGRLAAERDEHRDAWHRARGIRTLRVAAQHVLSDLDGVLHLIDRELVAREMQTALGEVSALLPNVVAPLVESASVVEAEIVRIARACETVLPVLGRRSFLARAGLVRR